MTASPNLNLWYYEERLSVYVRSMGNLCANERAIHMNVIKFFNHLIGTSSVEDFQLEICIYFIAFPSLRMFEIIYPHITSYFRWTGLNVRLWELTELAGDMWPRQVYHFGSTFIDCPHSPFGSDLPCVSIPPNKSQRWLGGWSELIGER